ncbi:dehydrogenase, partial [Candidatus Sumerlaeota bacterium]|nr:dehydrogenase [Candidatus Sumerlaeota bacterium]
NMWGLDYDEHGNLFASTNFGPYVMLHGVQGGYYWKSFGKHGELHNPYAYGYFDHMTQHDPQGGHVTDGGIVYQGDSLPAPFRGKYIAANLLSHTVYWHRIQPTGSTFESFHEGVLLDSHDNWFAPSDVTTGPDGAVYVADWNDKRTAHPDPDADWDRSNGRVYKIEAEGTKRVPPFDLSKLSSGELVNLLDHPNAWFRRRARVLLAERRDREVIPHLQKRISKKKSGPAALETLWALHVGGGFDKKTANALLKSADADLRRWAVRLIGEEKSLGESLGKDLTALAKTEKEVTVRSQLAQTAQRIPPREGLALAGELLKRDEDARDPHLPLLLWWAIEPRAMTETDSLLKRFCEPSAWKKTMIRETIIPRLVRRYATEGSPAADEACLRLIASAPATEERRKLTAALDQGLNDRSRTTEEKPPGNLYEQYAVAKEAVPETNSGTKSEAKPPSARLKEAIFKLWESDAGDSVAMSLSARLGYAPAIERAKQIAADPNAAAGDRAAMIGIIGQSGRADAVPLLLGLFSRDASAPVRMAALDAARRFPDDTVAAALIAAYAGADADMQSHIRDALFSREEWSREFLAAVDAGTLSAPDIPMTQLRRIALHGDADLNALVTKHWGAVREGTPEEKLADMRRLNNDLRAAPGNPAKGKETFTRLCSRPRPHAKQPDGHRFSPRQPRGPQLHDPQGIHAVHC